MKAVVAFVIALGIGIGYCATTASAVLYRTYAFGGAKQKPLAIFNPFRDRSPEAAADAFLRRLHSARPAEVLGEVIADPERLEVVITREAEHPIESWTLGDRSQCGHHSVFLHYWPTRRHLPKEDCLPVTVVMRKFKESWKVEEFIAAY